MISCSDGGVKKKYAIPKSLCGVAVPSDVLSPFLPGGSEISVKEIKPESGTRSCQVAIDGEVAFVANREWWMKNDGKVAIASQYHQLKHGTMMDEGRYLYSATGAVGKINTCVNSQFPFEVMFTVIWAEGDVDGDAHAMKKLITAYSNNVGKSSDCS